jgi:hypothetical protein
VSLEVEEGVQKESIEWFIEDQDFLPSFGSSPTHFPLLLPQSRLTTHRKTKKEIKLAGGRGGRGVGEEPNHTTV